MRSTDEVTIKGETHTVSEWLQKIGLSASAYRKRLYLGMSVEDALTMKKMKPGRDYSKPIAIKKRETPVKKEPEHVPKRVFVRSGGGAGTWRWI